MSAIPILGGLFSGISNIVGSAISADAQDRTNEKNLEIARENNAAMLAAMREQTRTEQEYNSISAQMQRAMIAGANPMLLAGANPATASAAGVPSLDSPVMQNPYQSFQSLGANLGSAILHAENIALQEKQINVAEFKSKIDMLQTLGEIGGSVDWSSSELKGVIKAVFGDSFDTGAIGSFARDNMVMTRLKNSVELSNLDVNQKKYLFGWLDEFTNAQFMYILAQTEQQQTQSNVNRSISSLNSEKKKEVTQAIKNMQEEWKSLNATGEMDVHRLERFVDLFDAQVKKIVSEAHISEKEAKYYIWSKINETMASLPFSGGVTKKF